MQSAGKEANGTTTPRAHVLGLKISAQACGCALQPKPEVVSYFTPEEASLCSSSASSLHPTAAGTTRRSCWSPLPCGWECSLHPQARAGAFPSRSAEFPSSHPELSQPIRRPSKARHLFLFGLEHALIMSSLPLVTIIKRSCLRLTSWSWSSPNNRPKSLPGQRPHLGMVEGLRSVLQVLILHRHLTTTYSWSGWLLLLQPRFRSQVTDPWGCCTLSLAPSTAR